MFDEFELMIGFCSLGRFIKADCGVCAVRWTPSGFYRRCGGLLPASSNPCSEGFDWDAWSLDIIQ